MKILFFKNEEEMKFTSPPQIIIDALIKESKVEENQETYYYEKLELEKELLKIYIKK